MSVLETDASPVENVSPDLDNAESYLQDNIFKIVRELKYADLKSILFIVMDELGCERYLELLDKPVHHMQIVLLICIQKRANKVNFVMDLLRTVQKDNLLKRLGISRHQYLKHDCRLATISSVWKCLYFVCESLDDSEVQELGKVLRMARSTVGAEELLCNLFIERKIDKDNFFYLERGLHSIRRPELAAQIHALSGSTRNFKTYYIRYPTKTNPCGLAVIINQEYFSEDHSFEGKSHEYSSRPGSKEDRDKLCELWNGFGFKVEVHNNLKASEIYDVFKSFSTVSESWDVFVACLLSHGDDGIIYGTDWKEVVLEELIEIVANRSPPFNNKPKLFFVQACQGQKMQQGAVCFTEMQKICLQSDAISEVKDSKMAGVNLYSDVYVAMATISGYVSFRNKEKGSLFISALVKFLKSHGHEEDIEKIMKLVKSEITQLYPLLQTPVTKSTLKSILVFKKM